MVNKVTKYSPNGNALEEVDNLGIPSAAKYGYGNINSTVLPPTMPIMVAKNAEYATIFFEDFESAPSTLSLTTAAHHSGIQSLKVAASATYDFSIKGTTRLLATGGSVRLWVKDAEDYKKIVLAYGSIGNLEPEKVAQSGEWILLSYYLKGSDIPSGNTTITVINGNASNILIDDVRFQPIDAQSTCFVYDINTLKLSAQFDDQHFGTYFVYNGEGKLVRKIVETEKGLKTLQENEINKSKVPR
jgi:hypothetical protein